MGLELLLESLVQAGVGSALLPEMFFLLSAAFTVESSFLGDSSSLLLESSLLLLVTLDCCVATWTLGRTLVGGSNLLLSAATLASSPSSSSSLLSLLSLLFDCCASVSFLGTPCFLLSLVLFKLLLGALASSSLLESEEELDSSDGTFFGFSIHFPCFTGPLELAS